MDDAGHEVVAVGGKIDGMAGMLLHPAAPL